MEKKFDVINFGQGDSFILRSSQGCKFNKINLGDGKRDVSKLVGDKVNIIFTHSHKDHIMIGVA